MTEEKLSSEEERQKTETLFSKKFREYLTSKKSSTSENDKSLKPTAAVRDYSTSSGETTTSESSKKSGRKSRKKLKSKASHWDFNYAFRNRLTQCSLLKGDEGIAPPEDLKPLLLNMTILLQELKQSPSEFQDLYNLISKITILVTEFIRRPLKKTAETNGEHLKKIDKIIEAMMTVLHEYKNGPNFDSDNRIREYKKLEKEIANKSSQITDTEKKIVAATTQNDPRVKDLNIRVRNSIMANERLKSEIKFNQNHVKKYKKVLVEKEWVKHKLENELLHLKKKLSKADLCDTDSLDKQQPEQSDLSIPCENIQVALSPKSKHVKTKKGKEAHKAGVKPK